MILPKQSEPVMRNVFTVRISGAPAGVTPGVAARWTAAAYGQIVPAQQRPLCGTGDFTGCTIPTPNCPGPGGCMQECVSVAGVITNECCPAEKCAPRDECCKQVCCEVVVKLD